MPKPLISRLRLAPIIMVAVLATISVKANHLWDGLSLSLGRASQAQAANNQAQQPAAAANNQPGAAQTGAPTQLGANQSQNGQNQNGAATPSPATPSPATPSPATAAQGAANPQPATPQQPATPAQTAQVQPPTPPANQPAANSTAGSAPAQPAAAGSDAQQSQDLLAQDQQRKLARDPFNYTDEEVDVLQQLAKRRTELDQRARQLDEREALVKAAEQRMDQKMAELKALQATVQDLLKQRNAADEQQLQSLVKIYENMKPKAAAQIFEEMDMDVLLDVVSRMNERKVSPILALVSPTRAKELTFELAERRQLPIPQ